MMSGDALSERLLVLMPSRRDAERTQAALKASSIACVICDNLEALCLEITRGAGAALLTEQDLSRDKENCLGQTLRNQPPWSDFPLIVLAEAAPRLKPLANARGLNMTLVEKPVRFATLRSVVETALRHRRRQYEVRDTMQDLRQAQHELKQANLDLEKRVEERTLKLREIVGELEAFSYTVSHDLRSPLRSIHGYAEVLLSDHAAALNDQGRHFLSKISAGTARLDLMVQDVLAYSRLSKGQVELQEVSVEDVIKDVTESYPQLRGTGAVRIDGTLPQVMAHPAYLTQCVSNLLGNAVKFVRPGHTPHVTVRAELEPGGEKVRVWFEDHGIGIAPQHFAEIFEIFGRVHSPQKYEGTGIGLAIVRKAAERMGGSAGVESELGKGSRFWLSLKKAP